MYLPASSKFSYSKSFLVKGISTIGTVPHAYRELKLKCFVKKCKQQLNIQGGIITSGNNCS